MFNRDNLLVILIAIMLLSNIVMLIAGGAGILATLVSIIIGIITGFAIDKFFENKS